jgi:RNA recognition motif-containing protein
LVALKIRGLPYQVRYEEVSEFFKNFNYTEKSVVLGLGHDGRKNGFGAILFESESEAKSAMTDLQGEHIGDRYVELSLISYGDYLRFNGPVTSGSGSGTDVRLSQYVGEDNKDRCLVCRGLPYKITADEVVEFFKGYGKLSTEDVFIEEYRGSRTGSALIIFESHDVAQDAKVNLQGQTISGNRYVDLFDCNDTFM